MFTSAIYPTKKMKSTSVGSKNYVNFVNQRKEKYDAVVIVNL